jgi:hypothetical protein
MGRKAIGPFERMAAVLPKGEFQMKKMMGSLLLAFVILASSITSFASTSNFTSDLTMGVVGVQLTEAKSTKILLLVEKDGQRYTYPIVDQDVNQFPLQMGNGKYTVRLMQNVTGTSYRELSRTTVDLKLTDSNKVFLNSIQDIEWHSSQAAIVKAAELTKGLKTDSQKISAIYNYITKNYKYDYDKAKTVQSGYFPNVEATFTSKTGICYDYSALLAAMARSVGIPTKLVKGYATTTKDVYHAWNEVLIDGQWRVIDATVDAPMVQANRRVTMFKSAADYRTERIY